MWNLEKCTDKYICKANMPICIFAEVDNKRMDAKGK